MRYDVVVVGGGTSGCVLATRLSEDPAVSVLLIEAGGDERRATVEVPDRWEENLGTETDWQYRTVPQPETGRAYDAPRGRVLGGSGSINCMTHLRGHRLDYEEWERLGAAGWGYDGVLPYFKRSEDVPDGDPHYRGTGGPLHPRITEDPSAVGERFIASALRLGHRRTEDFNAADMQGVGYSESLIRDGKRESTATAYLRPAIGRPNLEVDTDARVVGLVLDGATCRGVRMVRDGAERVIEAGEVVLAAGAVGSPHLLMLSGVGPAGQLQAAGVRVVHDLSGVGANLQDHVLLTGVRYRAARSVNDAGMGGAVLLTRIDDAEHGPDLLLNTMNIDYHMPWQDGPVEHPVTFGIGHMRPHSRGSITLRSADPMVAPLIDPAYVRESADLDALIRGVEIVEGIVQDGAFAEWGGSSDTTRILSQSRADVEAAVKDAVGSYFHLSGTCRVGVDADAVVAPDLRVHGIDGLRVADASIMPVVVSCNTNAAAVMIGEKAADLVRGRAVGAP
ncbi:MAG: GMC family oxidoreductase N-terminal domain-containing protein [Nocardioides sp.]|uniref:GMC family oxidoreductase n=1 Tax=Nocardioides sp. TaxID=35761 RepID=UPI0039E221DB